MRERMVTEDATTVGLVPGYWPETVEFKGRTFARWRQVESERGDLVSMVYKSKRGATLEVLK